MRDLAVHDAPQSLDGVEMRRVGGEEVQLDPALRSGQPLLDQPGMMVARVVEDDMDAALVRVAGLDCVEQSDGADGIDPVGLDERTIEAFQIEGAVEVDTLTPRGAAKRDVFFPPDPAMGRA